MLTAKDLHGVMGMMPSFATPDAVDVRSTATIHVENLQKGVDRMIKDGIDVIATTGTYGECYNLLWDEFKTLAAATVETVKTRVPLFIGTTSPNPREVIQKMKFVQELGADGVLLGVPYYVPSTVANAIQFYHDIASLFPKLAIMIYHNPENHKFTIPVSAFEKLVQNPNIIGMKDSHRETRVFLRLQEIIQGKISVFVNQVMLVPYARLGAAGCWSTEVWMGPWPVLHLRNLVNCGEDEEGKRVIMDLLGPERGSGEGGKRPQEYASYCNVGPSRVPFVHFSEAQLERGKKRAAYWEKLCEKYRPLVEAETKGSQKSLSASAGR
jgi:4-(2-carboxyphenyl)-2-oxobut-3-enoate aldolase